MKARLFILDDDPDLVKIATKLLTDADYSVRSATDATAGIKSIQDDPPELLLLDLRLGTTDGYQVCKELKSHPKTNHFPIIFLSAQRDEADVVAGLELGAADYITKPFRSNELLARIKTALRRQENSTQTRSSVVGPFRIDFAAYKVWLQDKELDLTPKEFELLAYFAKREGQAVTRMALSEAVWGANISGTSRTVDMSVERLRKKLGKFSDCIKGLRGVGYRFEVKED